MDNPLAVDVDELAERVQDLPPELYNMIHDLTFTPTTERCQINIKYKSPSYLQVDRATRVKAAVEFYRDTTFVTSPAHEENPWHSESLKIAAKWLASVPKEYHEYLTELRIPLPHDSDFYDELGSPVISSRGAYVKLKGPTYEHPAAEFCRELSQYKWHLPSSPVCVF